MSGGRNVGLRGPLNLYLVVFGVLSLTGRASASETIQVEMKNIAFAPNHIVAHVGDTIDWVNRDFVAHTATARNGGWDIAISANATRTQRLTSAGTITFFCRYHPNMTGEMQVLP